MEAVQNFKESRAVAEEAKSKDPSLSLLDPRVPLAAERTLLAWLRTGMALMGFGFVVARFGLFLQEVSTNPTTHLPVQSHGISVRLGIFLVLLGVMVNLLSAWKYRRYLRLLAAGIMPRPDPRAETCLALMLALVGLATAIYLLVLI